VSAASYVMWKTCECTEVDSCQKYCAKTVGLIREKLEIHLPALLNE